MPTETLPAVAPVLDLLARRRAPAAPASARLRRLGRLQAADLRASAGVHAAVLGRRRA